MIIQCDTSSTCCEEFYLPAFCRYFTINVTFKPELKKHASMNTENQESMAPQSEEQNHENLEQQVLPTESEQVKAEVKNLEITGDINAHLTEAGKWGSFLSILGFVFVGLIVMVGFVVSIVFAFLPSAALGRFTGPYSRWLTGRWPSRSSCPSTPITPTSSAALKPRLSWWPA